jgi:hypothetical protein
MSAGDRCPQDDATFEEHYDCGFTDGQQEVIEALSEEETINAVLAAVAQAWPTDSDHVADWHPDDIELHRQPGWPSFADRRAAVLAQRQRRVIEAMLAAFRAKVEEH